MEKTPLNIPVLLGTVRRDRVGIRVAKYLVAQLTARGHRPTLVDPVERVLPMLDRMFKEYEPGQAPPAMAALAAALRAADGFVFVVGEYNWGVQPGLKNLTDHFLEEWFWRPAAILSYSGGRLGGARAGLAWHGTLSEMGMVVVSSTVAVGDIGHSLTVEGTPSGEGGAALAAAFPRFAADLEWWAEAGKQHRKLQPPPF